MTYRCVLDTEIRKQHTDGKWYLIPFNQSCSAYPATPQDLSRLWRSIYEYQVRYIIQPDFKTSSGFNLCKLDVDQRPEEVAMYDRVYSKESEPKDDGCRWTDEDIKAAMLSMNIKRGLVQSSPGDYDSSWIQDHIKKWLDERKGGKGNG
jgi:hypothetical protein